MTDEQQQLPLMDERYFTAREVGEKFSVGPNTVLRWVRSGKLRAIKINKNTRIPESAIAELARKIYGE